MRWWLSLCGVVLVAGVAWAGSCTGLVEGDGCLLADNVTAGVCRGGACTRTFTVPAGEARTGTGTISSSGVIVTGSGTVFLTELQVGDTLISGSQRVAVTAIASNTSLTTDPAFSPVQSVASFTFANPILKFLDENGATVGLVNPRGLVAFGQSYVNEALTIASPIETAVGAYGKTVTITGGTGGPAGGSLVGGNGGQVNITGSPGGSSASATLAAGGGGVVSITGGPGGSNTGGGPVGGGGDVFLQGASSNGGVPGNVFIRGGFFFNGARGDINICDSTTSATSALLKIGGSAALTVDCITGGFTKIRNVTVSNFPPTNAVGILKNNGSGTYSLSAVAGTDFATQTANTVFAGPTSGSAAAPTFRPVVMADLPAAAQNAVNAFVHANAGGI